MIRVINSSNKIGVGSKVVITKEFENGSIILAPGMVGRVIDVSTESFPDLNIFNLRVITFKFGKYELTVGEPVIKGHIKKI